MTRFAIVLVLAFTSLVPVKPTFLPVPLTYTAPITPGTLGTLDSRPEMAVAGTRYTARGDERVDLETARPPRRRQSSSRTDDDVPTSGAPLGIDGRVVDTPEVAAAKAAHAAAYENERLQFAREAARAELAADSEIADSAVVGATSEAAVGPDGQRLFGDAPEHIARAYEELSLANEFAKTNDAVARFADVVPLVLGNGGVVAALVPVDGRPLPDAPEVAVRGNRNPLDNVKSVDALAVAGPALAYGRLVY